ncbi:hypothetical protein B0T22DRAFT_386637, partial [Podospora appendiculata]
SEKFLLHQLLDDPKYQGIKKLVYTYDFGDNWEYYMTVIGRAAPTPDFVCLSGSGHPVAEDASSHRGWEEVKAAYRAAKPTSEQQERREWFESMVANADPLGLAGDRVNFWDPKQVNKDLVTMVERFEKMADESQRVQDQISAAQAQRRIKPENVFRMDGGAFGRGPMQGR